MTFITLVDLLIDGIHDLSESPHFAIDENRADRIDHNVSAANSKLGLRMTQP